MSILLRRLVSLLGSLSVVVLLFLSPVLYYSYTSQSLSPTPLSQNIYSFLQGKGTLDIALTVSEKSHLYDVRFVFIIVLLCEIIAFIVVLSSIFSQKLFVRKGVFWGSLCSLSLLLVLLVVVIIDFQSLFLMFHNVFFPQGNWSFDSSSILIKSFPSSFFKSIAIKSFGTSTTLAAFLFLLSLYKRISTKE